MTRLISRRRSSSCWTTRCGARRWVSTGADAWKTSSPGSTRYPTCSPPTRRFGTKDSDPMKLLPLHRPELLEPVASWLAEKENYKWLDFGGGRQLVTPTLLKIMTQQESHFMRVYTFDRDDTPLGVLGLTSVDRSFKS